MEYTELNLTRKQARTTEDFLKGFWTLTTGRNKNNVYLKNTINGKVCVIMKDGSFNVTDRFEIIHKKRR